MRVFSGLTYYGVTLTNYVTSMYYVRLSSDPKISFIVAADKGRELIDSNWRIGF